MSLWQTEEQVGAMNDATGLLRDTSSNTNPKDFISAFEEKLEGLDISHDYRKYWRFSSANSNTSTLFNTTEYRQRRETRLSYDPRVTFAVYINHIQKLFSTQNPRNADNKLISVPFSWQDWVDLSVLNRYLELPENERPSCEDILTQGLRYKPSNKIETPNRNIDVACVDNDRYLGKANRALLPGFNFKDRTGKKSFREKVIHAKSHLLSYAPVPSSILFLTVNGTYEVSVTEDSTMMNSGLYSNFIGDEEFAVADPIRELERLTSTVPAKKGDIDFDLVFVAENDFRYDIPVERFYYPYEEIIADYENRIDQLSQKEMRHLDVLKYSASVPDKKLDKAFKEVNINWPATFNGHKVTENGGHYDSRFFNGFMTESKVNEFDDVNEKRKLTLHRILHTWLQFTYKEGIISFLAHGTLLSWYWDGLVFEWDDDIDVQMPIMDFDRFSMKFNNSLIVEDAHYGFGKFYVDCGAYPTHRTKGNGRNNIDARFIDVDSGMYIDITGLALTATNKLPTRLEKLERKLKAAAKGNGEYKDPGDIPSGRFKQARSGQRAPKGPETTPEALQRNKELNAFNCRNNHFYTHSELSPLRLSTMEGSPCFVPNDFRTVLTSEYVGGLRKMLFNKHLFVDELRFWLPSSTIQQHIMTLTGQNVKNANLKKFYNEHKLPLLMQFLGTDEILKEFYITHKYTKKHAKELELMGEKSDQAKINEYHTLLEEYKQMNAPMRKSYYGYMNEVIALGGYHPIEESSTSPEELDKIISGKTESSGKSQSNAGARRIQKPN
ncbi:hypothetical protein OGAPHI_003965 [Ogataea philodendri]|uniref:LicD/FKTN/FKRP nucleotidyltransferase domain-containing protein n=1 Tax=Ogataea philodendri TaxID=1378263 RepID=A0A9P8P5T4_9ASCO|nr:uncharacterized protein OGAPHI_003965 [Ogataea philodendri]KAH3665777.1 hypothetical protein OGAPHI_003965 [Ogataea philodendri]